MKMMKVSVLNDNDPGYSTTVHINPLLIAAVRPNDNPRLASKAVIIMCDGTVVPVEDGLENILDRLRLI